MTAITREDVLAITHELHTVFLLLNNKKYSFIRPVCIVCITAGNIYVTFLCALM